MTYVTEGSRLPQPVVDVKPVTSLARELEAATFSKKQFAAFLGVGLSTVNKLLSTKQIPSFKIGRRKLILIADAQAWLNRRAGRAA